MATSKSAPVVAMPALPIGVAPDGSLPLPWLAPPMQAAQAYARSHALLLQGPAGAGHLEFALLLAQTALCEAPTDSGSAPRLACGHCASCHLVATLSHPDLHLAMPQHTWVQTGLLSEGEVRERFSVKGEAKLSKELKIDQVRQGIEWTQQTSGRGRGKVLVLHPADALNTTAANALLKTLEEPPAGQRILLTTADAERLLPTVRSRCQRLPLQLPPADVALGWLQARGLAAPEALLAATGHSPLEALAWAAEGLDAALLAQLPQRVAVGDPAPLAGRAMPRVIDLLMKVAHDAMAQAAGGQPRFFAQATWPSQPADLAALVAWQQVLLRTARHEDHPWNAALLLESLLLQAARCWPARGPASGGAAHAPRGSAPLHSAP